MPRNRATRATRGTRTRAQAVPVEPERPELTPAALRGCTCPECTNLRGAVADWDRQYGTVQNNTAPSETPREQSRCVLCNSVLRAGMRGCCNNTCYDCFANGRIEHRHCYSCGEIYEPANGGCTNCSRCPSCVRFNNSRDIFDCEHCDRCCSCSVISSYSSRNYPKRRPLNPPVKPFLYLGVELEVETRQGANRQKVAVEIHKAHKKDILMKTDGSLNNGIELVTGPYSLDAHHELWPVLAPKAVAEGARSWRYDSTGLHVHLSRDFFTPLNLGKFVMFINSEKNRRHIVKLAGRSNNGYCKLMKKKITSARHTDGDKYEAVNLTNYDTIEVRIFKGTLKVEHILADIEFCHAVAYWVREQSLEDFENWEAFKAWVISNRKTYKYLSTYFKLGLFTYPLPVMEDKETENEDGELVFEEVEDRDAVLV